MFLSLCKRRERYAVEMKDVRTMDLSCRSSLYAVRFTFPNMAASYSCFYCTPACAQQGHDLPSSPWNPHITSCSIGLKTLVKFANVFWARAGFIFYISAVCPCFVSKTGVKVKYDCNRQCQDILTNFYVFRAMLVQNVVRRVAQAPALARAFTSTVPKPSNTPARKKRWQLWWCMFIKEHHLWPTLDILNMILNLHPLSLRVCQDQGEAEGLEGWQWPPGSRGDQIWPKPICQTYSCPNLRV